jgi:hypothetical protein
MQTIAGTRSGIRQVSRDTPPAPMAGKDPSSYLNAQRVLIRLLIRALRANPR